MSDVIYLVTEGEYSDYKVLCAFTKAEDAERATEILCGNQVLPVPLDVMPESPPGMLGWNVSMHENGDIEEVWRRPMTFPDKETPVYVNALYHELNPDPKGPVTTIGVWARDEEHAVKVASERRTKELVSGNWKEAFDRARKDRNEYLRRINEQSLARKADRWDWFEIGLK